MDSNIEEWRDIPKFEGHYMVSSLGRIKSLDRIVNHGYHNVKRVLKGRILVAIPNSKGYYGAAFSKDGKVYSYRVHRIVGTVFVENPSNYMEINHKNEIKSDNRASNLEWCSRLYNIHYGTGLQRRCADIKGKPNPKNWGEKCGTSKLKESQVIEIFKSTLSYSKISEKYKIGISTISCIKNKKTWIYLTKNL